MIGIGVDEFEMGGPVDRAQPPAVLSIAAVEAEHAHGEGPRLIARRG
jgi:hypothetical protein